MDLALLAFTTGDAKLFQRDVDCPQGETTELYAQNRASGIFQVV